MIRRGMLLIRSRSQWVWIRIRRHVWGGRRVGANYLGPKTGGREEMMPGIVVAGLWIHTGGSRPNRRGRSHELREMYTYLYN
jgi:hypothetical protein